MRHGVAEDIGRIAVALLRTGERCKRAGKAHRLHIGIGCGAKVDMRHSTADTRKLAIGVLGVLLAQSQNENRLLVRPGSAYEITGLDPNGGLGRGGA